MNGREAAEFGLGLLVIMFSIAAIVIAVRGGEA